MSKGLYQGPCLGGPLDGQEGQSRYSAGFLLVDKPVNQVWIYDYDGGVFTARDNLGEELVSDRDAPRNRHRAADEPNYDVIAAPWVVTE